MKTSLELYSLKTGNYPKPDNFSTITYSGGAVWYQGIVGDQVTTNLKSLNEKPLDPLTKSPYTYSVTQSFGEYEVLALYEGNVAYTQSTNPNPLPKGEGIASIFPQANAATTTLTPKVVGNYNGVYVKTLNYIIPTPSIIISEPLLTGIPLPLTSTNIRSQVITNGTNIPKNSLTQTQTGGLIGFNLAVFTGSITKNSPKAKKVEAITQIQNAYTGATSLNTKQNIAYILNQTSTGQIVALTDITLLKGQSSLTSNTSTNNTPNPSTPSKKTVLNCGIGTGVLYGTLDGTDVGLTCSDDIMVCNGTTGSGITISACNAGASIVYTNQSYPALTAARTLTLNTWMGGLYQWGNNADVSMVTATAGQVAATQIDSTYSYNSFRTLGTDWVIPPKNNNLWGNTTNTNLARKGPCPTDYHIPTQPEWSSVFTTILGISQTGFSKTDQLKIPAAGYRYWSNAGMFRQSTGGYYWSSSPSGNYGYNMYFDSTTIFPNNSLSRASGFSVRCFKN